MSAVERNLQGVFVRHTLTYDLLDEYYEVISETKNEDLDISLNYYRLTETRNKLLASILRVNVVDIEKLLDDGKLELVWELDNKGESSEPKFFRAKVFGKEIFAIRPTTSIGDPPSCKYDQLVESYHVQNAVQKVADYFGYELGYLGIWQDYYDEQERRQKAVV